VDVAGLLYLYRRIHNGQMVADDETNPLVSILRLSGITRGSKGHLQVRNRIYWQVFDGGWIQTNMPQAEVRRQRRAGRRGMLIGFGAAVFLLLAYGFFGPLYSRYHQARLAFKTTSLMQSAYQRLQSYRDVFETTIDLGLGGTTVSITGSGSIIFEKPEKANVSMKSTLTWPEFEIRLISNARDAWLSVPALHEYQTLNLAERTSPFDLPPEIARQIGPVRLLPVYRMLLGSSALREFSASAQNPQYAGAASVNGQPAYIIKWEHDAGAARRLEEIKATAAGTAAGPAVDLAKLGAQVTAVGAIGDDLIAGIITGVLASYGIDTRGLVRKAGRQTAASMLPIRPNGERPALHAPGAMPYLELDDIDPAWLDGCDVLLIGAPDRLGRGTQAGLTALAKTAQASGALVLIDVLGPGRPEDFERLRELIGTADWFCPNEDQLRRLTGRDDLTEAITDVLALGTAGVAVTLGENGALVSTGTAASPDPIHIPAHDITVVDTTGCGDAFDAGMITGLLLGCDPVDAARLGTACGALVATGLGSDAGITTVEDVISFLATVNPESATRIGGRLSSRQQPV
jgi:sugar/nucleoside kinase (ribokinase family)